LPGGESRRHPRPTARDISSGLPPTWMDKSYATQLSLARLTARDSLSVVRSVLPQVTPEEALTRLILDIAEGNPFFLEELARAVEYVVKHALTQDVAEATILAPRRRELHRRAADALAALDPERVRELAPLLAHHYNRAEAWSLACDYATRAAEAASAACANR